MTDESLIIDYLNKHFLIRNYCFYDRNNPDEMSYFEFGKLIDHLKIIFGFNDLKFIFNCLKKWSYTYGFIEDDFDFFIKEPILIAIPFKYNSNGASNFESETQTLISIITQWADKENKNINKNLIQSLDNGDLYLLLSCIGLSFKIHIDFDLGLSRKASRLHNYQVKHYRSNIEIWGILTKTNNLIDSNSYPKPYYSQC